MGEDRSDWQGFGSSLATAKARAAVWTSTDGRTWTRVPHATVFDVGGFIDTTEDPESGGMRDVVAGPDGLVAVGSVCTSKPVGCEPAAWTSPDGTSWERVADVPALSGRLEAIAASDTGYVAVGDVGCDPSHTSSPPSCAGLVLTSTDGRVWVQQPFEGPAYLRTVTAIGDRFFATATIGPETVCMSATAQTWPRSMRKADRRRAHGAERVAVRGGRRHRGLARVSGCRRPGGLGERRGTALVGTAAEPRLPAPVGALVAASSAEVTTTRSSSSTA